MGGHYEYWVKFLGHCLSLMIVTLSWCSVYWMRDKIKRMVAFFSISAIYILILTSFIPNIDSALMDHDVVGQAIIEAWEMNSWFAKIFFSNTFAPYVLFCIGTAILYGIYLLVKNLKHS